MRRALLYDALIIGAGPSGSVLARQLARGGWRVLVVDREPLGRDRACGGFLGPEITSLWRELDLEQHAQVLPAAHRARHSAATSMVAALPAAHRARHSAATSMVAALPAAPVQHLILSSPAGARIELPLPADGGLGVSRAIFDRWLCEHALDAGACVWPMTRVTRLEHIGRTWRAQLERAGSLDNAHVRVVVRACGRRAPGTSRPPRWGPLRRLPATRQARNNPGPSFGCKTVYAGGGDRRDAVALHFVRQGHVGFNRLPDGRMTMCLYVTRSRLQSVGGRLDDLMEQLAEESPGVDRHLRGATRTSPWLSCQAQPDHRIVCGEGGLLHVGDAVTMLNPILGGGMAVAMGSSILLSRLLLGAPLDSPAAHADLVRRYTAAWKQHFAGRARFGRWLGWCEQRPNIAERLLRILSTQPTLLSGLVRYSRPALRTTNLAMAR